MFIVITWVSTRHADLTDSSVMVTDLDNSLTLVRSQERVPNPLQGGIVDIPEFEVLFDSGAGNSGEESYGVVIETPNEVDQAVLKLNELLLEARGGTSLIWRGDVLADVDALENADNTSETALKRRPERWNMTVASGIVKARANQAETNVTAAPLPDLRRPMLSLNGFFRARLRPAPRLQNTLAGYTDPIIIPEGVNLSFDENGFTLEPISDDMGFIGGSVFGTNKQLNPRQIEQLDKTQALLLLLPDLADAQIAFEYVLEYTLGDNQEQNETDANNLNDSSLIPFLLENGVSIEALTQVVGDDPFIAEVLVNATFNDPNGIESVREMVAGTGDLFGMVELLTTIVDGDEVGVDLLIQATADSPDLTALLQDRLATDPLLGQQLLDRLTASPAAFETTLTNAEASPNVMGLLVSVAETDDSPLNIGTDLLLEVIGSSELALQNLVLALQNDPDTLAQFETLVADIPNLEAVLGQNGVLILLQQSGLLQPDPTDAPVFVVAQSNPIPVATLAPTLIATLDVPTLVATEPQVTQTIDPGVPPTATPDIVPPSVTFVSPSNGASVSGSEAFVVSFSETVTFDGATSWFTLLCEINSPPSISIYDNTQFTITSSGNTYTLTPTFSTSSVTASSCTATINGNAITDTVGNVANSANITVTPPDALPTIASTIPIDATIVSTDQSFTVNFSEGVTVSGTWFTVICTATLNSSLTTINSYTNADYTITPNLYATSYTLTPNTTTVLENNTNCTTTITGGNIRDNGNQTVSSDTVLALAPPPGCPNFNRGGTINLLADCLLDSNTPGNVSGSTQYYSIINSVTVNGNGFSIYKTGTQNGGLFLSCVYASHPHCSSANTPIELEFNNVTLNGGHKTSASASHNGGAFLIFENVTATFNNVTFSNNHAYYHGGAIQFATATVTVTINNSTFIGNSAGDGGAIYKDEDGSTLTINNSTFSGNTPNDIVGSYTGSGNTFPSLP